MTKTAQEKLDYNAKKVECMRKKRAHDKNIVICSIIINAMMADVFKVCKARDRCRADY